MELLSNLPIEIKVIAFFGLLWATGVLLGLPINYPDMDNFNFVEKHYFRPILMAFILQVSVIFISGIFKFKGNKKRYEPFLTLKLLYFMGFSVFLHFNFKAWMPLVNSHLYDAYYDKIDQHLWILLQLFINIRQFIANLAPFNLDFLYHHLFVAMFFISFSAHALFDKPLYQRQLVLGACLILLIGGLAYWIAPAEGAFLYRNSISNGHLFAQTSMHKAFLLVKSTGLLPAGYFSKPPAAMPSLHIALALCFTWFAGRSCRWLLFFYVPALSWLIIESVCSGWHYLIDLPAGVLVCIISISLAIKWLPDREMAQNKPLIQS
jgi:hypothetical protein